MSKKIYMLVLMIFCAAGIAIVVQDRMRGDHSGPEIHLPQEEGTLREGDDLSILLEGVTAIDDRDGDVTDSLMIEDVYYLSSEASAKVVYVAMDSSFNVTKVQRTVHYEAADTSAEENENGEETLPVSAVPETKPVETTAAAMDPAEANIAIINGSGVAGVAGEWQARLTADGFTNVTVGSVTASRVRVTTIYSDEPELLAAMKEYFPSALTESGMPTGNIDIRLDGIDVCVVLGTE